MDRRADESDPLVTVTIAVAAKAGQAVYPAGQCVSLMSVAAVRPKEGSQT
jgi:hypothetical protein